LTFWKNVLRPVIEEIGAKARLSRAGFRQFHSAYKGERRKISIEFCGREAGGELFIPRAGVKDDGRVEFSGLPRSAGKRVLFESRGLWQTAEGKFTDWFARSRCMFTSSKNED